MASQIRFWSQGRWALSAAATAQRSLADLDCPGADAGAS
jgi:hypothetical protein